MPAEGSMSKRDFVFEPARALPGAWRTIDLVVLVVVSLAFGAVYVAWGVPYELAAAFGGTPTQEALNAVWFVAGLFGPYLIRRPGAAIASETLASLAEMLVGAPWGPGLVIYGVMQSVGAEAVFALGGYRRWGLATMTLAGVAAGLVSLPYSWWDYGYLSLDPTLLGIMLVTRTIGVAVAGIIAKYLGDALAVTGVLNGVAIGRERMREV
jgi:energy-coupling factor transport system substrate-specific component